MPSRQPGCTLHQDLSQSFPAQQTQSDDTETLCNGYVSKKFCSAQSTNLSSPHSDFTDGLLGSYKALQLRKSDLEWKKEVQKDCLAASLFPLETRASVHL